MRDVWHSVNSVLHHGESSKALWEIEKVVWHRPHCREHVNSYFVAPIRAGLANRCTIEFLQAECQTLTFSKEKKSRAFTTGGTSRIDPAAFNIFTRKGEK